MSFVYMPVALRSDNNLMNIARWVNFNVENTLDDCSLILDGKTVPETAVYVGGYSFEYSTAEFGEDIRPAFDLANYCLNSNAPGRKVIGIWQGVVEVSAIFTPKRGENLTDFAREVLSEAARRGQTDIYVTRPGGRGALFPAQTTNGTINGLADYIDR